MPSFKEIQSSLIISVYKNTSFLDAVLKSLWGETFQNFEVIISEDGDSEEMRDFLSQVKLPFPVSHLTQEDIGWRKNRALNRAIREAKSDWLIFIDGDCVLHPRFMEFHWKMAEKKFILAGKRVKLDPETSELLISGKVKPEEMNSRILANFSKIKKQGGAFVEEDFSSTLLESWDFIESSKNETFERLQYVFSSEGHRSH